MHRIDPKMSKSQSPNFYNKRGSEDVMEAGIVSGEEYPRLCRWVQCNHRVLMGAEGRQQSESERLKRCPTVAVPGSKGSLGGKSWEPLETGKDKEWILPWRVKGTQDAC